MIRLSDHCKIVSAEFALTNRPSFYIALTAMIIGMQYFLQAFIAELILKKFLLRKEMYLP